MIHQDAPNAYCRNTQRCLLILPVEGASQTPRPAAGHAGHRDHRKGVKTRCKLRIYHPRIYGPYGCRSDDKDFT